MKLDSNITDRNSIINLKVYGDTFMDKIKDKITSKTVVKVEADNILLFNEENHNDTMSKRYTYEKINFEEKGNMIKSCNNMFSRIFTPKPIAQSDLFTKNHTIESIELNNDTTNFQPGRKGTGLTSVLAESTNNTMHLAQNSFRRKTMHIKHTPKSQTISDIKKSIFGNFKKGRSASGNDDILESPRSVNNHQNTVNYIEKDS